MRAPKSGHSRRAGWVLALTLLLLVAARGRSFAAETSLRLVSEPGASAGDGQNLFYTPADGTLSVLYGGASFLFETPDYRTEWVLQFTGLARELPAVGTYRDAWPPYWDDSVPGLVVYGRNGGCDRIRGSFQVKEAVYDDAGNATSFWAVFEQRCAGQRPALRGELRFNADVVVALTAPLGEIVDRDAPLRFDVSATDVEGRPVALTAAGLPSDAAFIDHGDGTGTFSWTPGFDRYGKYDVSFRADNGAGDIDETTTRIEVLGTTSLYIESEPGDPAGEGRLAFFNAGDGRYTTEKNSRAGIDTLFLYLPDYSQSWQLQFGAPFSVPLGVGTYAGATMFPAQDPSMPGLLARGDHYCSTVDGSFDVKQIQYGPVTDIASFWTTFEQHCDGATAALHGELRINADVPLLVTAPEMSSVAEDRALSVDVRAHHKGADPVSLSASDLPPGASFTDNGDDTGTLSWTPSVGQIGRYTVRLAAQDALGDVDRSLTRIQVRLKNDEIEDAIAFSSLPFEYTMDTSGATVGIDDPFDYFCPGYGVASAWYAFHPAKAVSVIATAGLSGPQGSMIAVYIGEKGALQKIACGNGGIRFDATAVHTYYFLVQGGANVFRVAAASTIPPRPANDDIHDATRITATPFVDEVDTSGAWVGRDDPKSCGGRMRTVWYVLKMPAHAQVTASTAGSDYAASVSAWTGSRGALHRIGCEHTALTFEGKKGKTYYLMVDADANDSPPVLRFSVDARTLLDLGLKLNAACSFDPQTSEASVGGQVTCSKPAVVALHGVIRQRTTVATFDVSVSCTGTTAWTAVAVGAPKPLSSGPASVAVDASSLDDVNGNTVRVRKTGSVVLSR
ncbi:MAG TPA: Ig domain-containing protein [Candidatus Polarisedimenticolaceae bacterium]|nr:Ig domain-containing protein [Candidatus Polarisedimenticolaceae bacterium]